MSVRWDEVSLEEFAGRDLVPQVDCLADYVDYWAERTPAALFDRDGQVDRNYDQAASEIAACAKALAAAGVVPGDRVAVLSDPRPEFITILAALGRVGAVWVGLNPAYTFGELEHVLADASPKLAFTIASYRESEIAADFVALARQNGVEQTIVLGSSANSGTVGWDEFIGQGKSVETAPAVVLAESDPALIVYTSGSTGRPKGAVISHGAFTAGCYLQASKYFHREARVIAYLPINHVAGLLDLGGVPIAMGGSLHYLRQFDPAELLAMTAKDKITMWGGVPTVMQFAAGHPDWAKTDFSSLEYLAWGGSPMPAELVPILRATGARLGAVYGLTESCVAFTYSDANATDEQLASTIGRPDPRLDFRIDGGDGPGELLLKNPCLMTEYLNQPEATAATFTPDGYLRTGDLAQMRPDGLIEIVGRLKEMFKSGGYNVYPREVELAIEEHEAVETVVVVPVPDERFHEVGVAFVVLAQASSSSVTADVLREHCRARLAAYKVPKRFELVDRLPQISIGKIDRSALRRLAAEAAKRP
ncbi:MAG TPA: class I adenylate-forming enzyme family protein [Aeromicrobium sp.]|nr:class I adenylate-forming enzyme family protein [Aeromicrobium sp.]